MNAKELNRAWVLYKAVQDKERFDKLSLEDKLEALRIVAIQTKDEER